MERELRASDAPCIVQLVTVDHGWSSRVTQRRCRACYEGGNRWSG